MKSAIFLIFWIMILAAPSLRAQDWQTAMTSSSARLRLYALMLARPDGAAEAVGQLQRSQGFGHRAGAGPQHLTHGLSLTPYLAFDNNINGGTPGQTIMIGPALFTISPASQAKQGFVAGLSGTANLRLSLSPFTVIEANYTKVLARALEYDLSVMAAQANLCLGQFLGGTDWMDLCVSHSQSQRASFQSDKTQISIGLTKQFTTRAGLHEAEAQLRQEVARDYTKLNLEMGLITAKSSLGLLDMRADIGQHIKGQHTRLFGGSIALSRPVWGKTTTVFASYAKEGGGAFFGDPRVDEVFSLGLSRPLYQGLAATMTLRDRKSTLANYDGVTLGLDFNFSKVTF